MQKNIWHELPKPLFILAPMENVTDTVFRQIVLKTGKPSLFFTEFTSTDGLCSVGMEKVAKRLQYTSEEKPLIAQIWGTDPEKFYKSSQMIQERGFDGIDINMGCPVRDIVSHGSCSALINNPKLAAEIIQATKEGAGGLPVSVKTRIGFTTIVTEEWLGYLLQQNIVALTIHGRTAKEMSKVPAHWDEIGKAVVLRNKIAPDTLVIGNGDIQSHAEGLEKIATYQLDGVMVGRGIFTDLWIFNDEKDIMQVSHEEKLRLLIEHIELFESTWQGGKPYEVLKKYFKIYTSGMLDASEFRMHLMEQKTPEAAIAFIQDRLQHPLQ